MWYSSTKYEGGRLYEPFITVATFDNVERFHPKYGNELVTSKVNLSKFPLKHSRQNLFICVRSQKHVYHVSVANRCGILAYGDIAAQPITHYFRILSLCSFDEYSVKYFCKR